MIDATTWAANINFTNDWSTGCDLNQKQDHAANIPKSQIIPNEDICLMTLQERMATWSKGEGGYGLLPLSSPTI